MKHVHKILEWAFYLFFGMMLFGALMVVVGFVSVLLSFGTWTGGYGWLAPKGGFLFGAGFFCLIGTGLVGALTGYLK